MKIQLKALLAEGVASWKNICVHYIHKGLPLKKKVQARIVLGD